MFHREPSDSRPREASIPISTSTAADPDRPGPPSEPGPSTALVPLAGADEDEMMEDVAQMAGGGQVSGQDALTNLETTLRPVEKYAVRFLEEVGSYVCHQYCWADGSRPSGHGSRLQRQMFGHAAKHLYRNIYMYVYICICIYIYMYMYIYIQN